MSHLYFKIQSTLKFNLLRFYTSCQPLLCINSKSIYQPSSFAYLQPLSGYFALSNAFFSIAHVLSFTKIDNGTLKSSLMADFMQINNPSPY